jgi:hypothetical protein
MIWANALKAALPPAEIPDFLLDLQALVAALREDRAWQHLLTPRLRAQPDLVLSYLTDGPKKRAVAAAI